MKKQLHYGIFFAIFIADYRTIILSAKKENSKLKNPPQPGYGRFHWLLVMLQVLRS